MSPISRPPMKELPEPPYSGGTPAPGSALTPEMLKLLGRPIPMPPIDDEPPTFSEDARP